MSAPLALAREIVLDMFRYSSFDRELIWFSYSFTKMTLAFGSELLFRHFAVMVARFHGVSQVILIRYHIGCPKS